MEEGALARFESGVATHIGRRPQNEDSYCVAPEIGLYVVADGLGGYEGGEIASSIVVHVLAELIGEKRREMEASPSADDGDRIARWQSILVEGAHLAHEQIVARQIGKLGMMGSTLAAILIPDGEAIVCHVGDSRVYLLRAGELKQLTLDHSLYAEMLALGVDAGDDKRAIFANELTRALGMEGSAEPDVAREPIRTGDVFLLCTDGLYDSLRQGEITQALQAPSAQEACDRLVSQAYKQGSLDNITALVVRVVEE
jgi:serine/threonine protein phosphatase PrpC